MADLTFGPKTYTTDGGDKHVIASGGTLDIESGGSFEIAGVQVTATAAELNTIATVEPFTADTGGVSANDLIFVSGFDTPNSRVKMDQAQADSTTTSGDLYWTDAAVLVGAAGSGKRHGSFTSALNGTAGDPVYLSPSVAGAVTLTRPVGATDAIIEVGTLATSGASGIVHIDLGGETVIQHDHSNTAEGGTLASIDGLTGTTEAAFETDTDGTVPALALGSQAAGTGDFTLTIKPASTITGNADVIIPDGADTFCMIADGQVLTNKTLTTPTIGDFQNATHDHSNAAGGGTLTAATASTGTSNATFEINTTGNSVTLSSSGLGANRVVTFPDEAGETCLIAANQTLTNKTLTTPTIASLANMTHDHADAAGGGAIAAGSLVADNIAVGGGYGSTGATLSTAGVGQFNGALTTDGALTADNIVCTNAATFGGGYGSTGATISTAGVGQFNGALTTDGALTADSAAIGGGYGSTGVSLSNTGVGQFNGALTTDGLLTADSVQAGGGYGATGSTLSNTGVGQFNGALTTDGLLTAATITVDDATTPAIALATGKTNTGTITINGKTSGSLVITAADATAEDITLNVAAQTVGSATLSIPDMANTSANIVLSEGTNAIGSTDTHTGNLDISGATVVYRDIVNADIAVGAVITRAKLAQSVGKYSVPWHAFKKTDMVTNLAATGDGTSMGIAAGTHGTDAPKLVGFDTATDTKTDLTRFFFTLPPEYDAGQTIILRCRANVDSDPQVSATLDAQIFLSDDEGLKDGVDLVATNAIDIKTEAWGNRDFTINAGSLAPGDVLDCELTTVVNDAGGGGTSKSQIGLVQFMLDIRG